MAGKIDLKALAKRAGKVLKRVGPVVAIFLLVVFIYERVVVPSARASGKRLPMLTLGAQVV